MGRLSNRKHDFAVLARRVRHVLCEGGPQRAMRAWQTLNRDDGFRGFLTLRAAHELNARRLPADYKRFVIDEAFYRLARALRRPTALRFAAAVDDAAFARRLARVTRDVCSAAAGWLAGMSLLAPCPAAQSRQRQLNTVIELELRLAALPARQRTIATLAFKGHAIEQIARQLDLSWLQAYRSWRSGVQRLRREIRAARKS